MGSIIWNGFVLICWVVITMRIYLNLADIDWMLALSGTAAGLYVCESGVEDFAKAVEKWRRK